MSKSLTTLRQRADTPALLQRTFIYISGWRPHDGRPLHMANLSLVVIIYCNMVRAAVVPHNQIILAPLMAIDELRASSMLAQELDQGPTLFCRHASDLFDFLL